MDGLFKLVDRVVVPCESMDEWIQGQIAGQADRNVGLTYVGRFLVSTVFLGIDSSLPGSPAPIVFETMIFSDGKPVRYITRCSTWEDAERMHAAALLSAATLEKQGRPADPAAPAAFAGRLEKPMRDRLG